jgi:hypothetical protein
VNEHHAAIERLLVEYAAAMDDGDFARVGQLFSRATWRNQDDPTRVLAKGDAQITSLLSGLIALPDGRPGEQHLSVHPVIEVDADARLATARSSYVVLMAAPGFPLQATGAGRYVDQLVRDARGWYFTDRLFCQDLRGDLSAHTRAD